MAQGGARRKRVFEKSLPSRSDVRDFMAGYPIDPDSMGIVLIFSNVHFRDRELNRPGGELDVKRLREFFPKVGYQKKDIYVFEDRTIDQMDVIIQNVKRYKLKSSHSTFVLCVMSHGGENDYVIDYEKTAYNLFRDVIKPFCDKSCPVLHGKPKLVITQCCQGGDVLDVAGSDDLAHLDSYSPDSTQEWADLLVLKASPPFYSAFRLPQHGSVFIQTFCDTCESCFTEMALTDVMGIVIQKVSEKEEIHLPDSRGRYRRVNIPPPAVWNTLRRKFFLFDARSVSQRVYDEGPSERREDESQMLEDQLYSLTVIKYDKEIQAVRSDSHNLTSAASVIQCSCDENKLSCRVWEVTDHKDLSWRQRDLHVNHTLNLQKSPQFAHVITIVHNILLVQVTLEDVFNSQVISVNSSTSHVINKSQVYPGLGLSGYCRYKSQILLPDQRSSSITQLDLKTLNHVNTWSDDRVGPPGRVCSNMNRAAVCDNVSESILVFRWNSQQISHDLIFTVKSGSCRGMQLLTDDTVMAINWDREWSVWDESGTCVHNRVQHPVLVSGMGIICHVMQDAVTGECFVHEYGKLNDRTECEVIYNARLVLKRIETEDKSQIDESQLKMNKTIKLK